LKQGVEVTGKVFVEDVVAVVAVGADVHGSGMQVDTAVRSVADRRGTQAFRGW
jgi:hypothetical protein